MDTKIKHPWIAFIIIFVIITLMSEFGIIESSLLLFDLLAGIIIYKAITYNR